MDTVKKVAMIYDFDKTLSPRDMQDYQLLASLGYTNAIDFWSKVGQQTEMNRMDPILSYMLMLMKEADACGRPLNRDMWESYGRSIEFFDGLPQWFDHINSKGKSLGLTIEHYVISSGLYELVSHSAIAPYLKKIYACAYVYDEHGQAIWPANVVNYTTKTQYIFRINKQVLDISNEADLNAYTPKEKRPIPFERMIYIADGYTDVPVFKLIKEYGGTSIGVYSSDDHVVKQLYNDGRLNAYVRADYTPNGQLDHYMDMVLNQIRLSESLNDYMDSNKED